MQLGTFLRFATVGVAVAALYVALYLAFQSLDVPRLLANTLAFGIAVLAQYAGQARFTYRRQLANAPQIARFAVMIAAGFVTSVLVTSVIGPRTGLSDGLAAGAVALLLPVQNLILMTLWVFSSQQLRGGDLS